MSFITESVNTIWNGMEHAVSNILAKFHHTKTKDQIDTSKDVDEAMFDYSEYVSTKGILGLPPRFSSLSDMRLFSVSDSYKGALDPAMVVGTTIMPDAGAIKIGSKSTHPGVIYSPPYEGSKWLDVYMKWGSLVFLEIGRPLFFKGLNKELVNAILTGNAQADEALGSAMTAEAAKTNVANTITFKPAGVDYAYQVKILTDTLATFLALDTSYVDFRNNASGLVDGKDVADTSTLVSIFKDKDSCSEYFGLPTASMDLADAVNDLHMIKSTTVTAADAATNPNAVKAEPPKKVGKFDLTPLTNEIFSEVISSTIAIYTDGGVDIPFNMQHSTGPSKLLGMLTNNPISDATSELAFLVDDFNYQVDQSSDTGLLAKIESPWVKKVMGAIPIGAKLIAPEVWQSVDIVKSATFKVILQAANPHKIAVFNEVLVPYMHLFAAFAPMNITSVSNRMMNRVGAYAPPFVVRMYSKGAVNINLGIMTSITVHKVPKELTVDGLPTRLEIDIEVKDLYDVMGIPQHPTSRSDVLNCMGLTEYLGSLTGVSMSNEKMLTRYADTISDKKSYAFSLPKRMSNRLQQNIANGWNQHVAAFTAMVYGRVSKI